METSEKEKAKSIAIMEEIKIRSIPVDLSYTKGELIKIKKEQEELIGSIQKVETLEELKTIEKQAIFVKEKIESLKTDVEKES